MIQLDLGSIGKVWYNRKESICVKEETFAHSAGNVKSEKYLGGMVKTIIWVIILKRLRNKIIKEYI